MRPYLFILFVLAALVACTAEKNSPVESADAIYANGKIWTGNPASPWAEGLAVKGDKIVALESGEALSNWRGLNTEYHDLAGKLVVPGFQDSHVHMMYNSAIQVDLAGAETLLDVQTRIRDFASSNPELPWIQGFGWGYGAFPEQRPLALHLDAAVNDRPVFVTSRDGHMALANTMAVKMAGVNSGTVDPENGRIVRDDEGNLTGEFQEKATALINKFIPAPTTEERYQAFLTQMDIAAAAGITAFHEAGAEPENIPLFERALREDKLLQRVELALRMVTPEDRAQAPVENIAAHILEAQALGDRLNGPYLRMRSIKAITDGTIDATTAAMFENYVGTETSGLPFWELETLKQTVAMYDEAGFQVILHAIGDRAISECLDAFDYAQKMNGPRDGRHRIEHAELPRLADLERFRKLGVIASNQPMFAYPDTTVLENYAPLLGHDRAQYANNFALWDEAGIRQIFGSDNPVMTLSVLSGIETVVTRMTETANPPGGWYPDGRISVTAALQHYTSDSAWGTHDEKERGTLEVGKLADFVVLSRNIFDIPPSEISETEVLRTVMGGRHTYISSQIETVRFDLITCSRGL